jgi:hypothetical protein
VLLFRLERHKKVDGRSDVEWGCGELERGRKERWMQVECGPQDGEIESWRKEG